MDLLAWLRPRKGETMCVSTDEAYAEPGVIDGSPQWRWGANTLRPQLTPLMGTDTFDPFELPITAYPGQNLGGYSWERNEARDHNTPDATPLGGYYPTLPNYRREDPYIPVLVEGMQIRSAAGLDGYPSQGRGNNDHAHVPPLGFTEPDGTYGVALNMYSTSANPVEVPPVVSPPWTG